MKNEFETLYSYDINDDIIDGILFLYSEINKLIYNVPTIKLDHYNDNEPFYIEDVQNIEEVLNNISSFLYKTDEFKYKKWFDSTKILDRTFDYQDFNRWIVNIQSYKDLLKKKILYWNQKKGTEGYEWNISSELEWSDL